MRIHHWLHIGRKHENVPNETAFVLHNPKNLLLFQQHLANELVIFSICTRFFGVSLYVLPLTEVSNEYNFLRAKSSQGNYS